MSEPAQMDRLYAFRRDLHRHPEPAWCEFYTTARIVEEIDRLGVDERYVGIEAIDPDRRLAVPDADQLAAWAERARSAGVREDMLEVMAGGYTGCVAIIERGDGPVIGVRVDIDALPITESTAEGHRPATEGFRSEHEGYMHACGHDAHATIGLGVIARFLQTPIDGTLKVFFQPSEEVAGGGRAMAESGHLDDVDYLLAIHVGLDYPTGTVVAGFDGFLAVTQFDATFDGTSAHAGARPNEGANAVHAMATAIENLYGIPRHTDGATRINVGRVSGGTAANIVPERATLVGEVRGESTELMRYMLERADRIVRAAAEMHGCRATVTRTGEAPGATSDPALAGLVADVAGSIDGVDTVHPTREFAASEDATYLMKRVQDRGGRSTYIGIGTDHPGGHHTPTFDVDDRSIAIGVDLISAAVQRLATDTPPT